MSYNKMKSLFFRASARMRNCFRALASCGALVPICWQAPSCEQKNKESFTMPSIENISARSAKICLGFCLLAVFLAAEPAAHAQYPTTFQISKDGTAVLLEDYATPPLSSATHGGATSTEINLKGQLGRITALRAEPANAPLAASRIFVDDQNGTLYILDTSTKKFTPYLKS